MSFVTHFVGSFCDAPMVRDLHRDRVRAWGISMAVTTDEGVERRLGKLLGELDLITRAVEDKIPGDILLVDAASGASSEFKSTVRMFGLDLGVAITETTKVWLLDTIERRHGAPLSAHDLGVKLGRGAFRRLTWRVGPGGKLSSRFAFRRVKVVHDSTERPICPRRATSPSRAVDSS